MQQAITPTATLPGKHVLPDGCSWAQPCSAALLGGCCRGTGWWEAGAGCTQVHPVPLVCMHSRANGRGGMLHGKLVVAWWCVGGQGGREFCLRGQGVGRPGGVQGQNATAGGWCPAGVKNAKWAVHSQPSSLTADRLRHMLGLGPPNVQVSGSIKQTQLGLATAQTGAVADTVDIRSVSAGTPSAPAPAQQWGRNNRDRPFLAQFRHFGRSASVALFDAP